MDTLKVVLISAITSSTIIGLLIYILKKFFGDYISHYFEKRSLIVKHEINQKLKFADSWLEREFLIYPEMLEVIYRLRNNIRDGIKKDKPYDWNQDLISLWAHLRENLYRYKPFLSQQIFKKMHRFTKIATRAKDLRQKYTQEEHLFDNISYRSELDKFHREFREMDNLYQEIDTDIRALLNSRKDLQL